VIFTLDVYPFYPIHGIRQLPCCVRDVVTSVLSQHLKKGYLYHTSNAIGFGQGGASVAAPILLRQVQNSTTHGMAGTFLQPYRLFF